jgi:hypothetical protein
MIQKKKYFLQPCTWHHEYEKKHVVNEHGVTLNQYKEQKKTTNEEGGLSQQKRKNRKIMPPNSITNFFGQKIHI